MRISQITFFYVEFDLFFPYFNAGFAYRYFLRLLVTALLTKRRRRKGFLTIFSIQDYNIFWFQICGNILSKDI